MKGFSENISFLLFSLETNFIFCAGRFYVVDFFEAEKALLSENPHFSLSTCIKTNSTENEFYTFMELLNL